MIERGFESLAKIEASDIGDLIDAGSCVSYSEIFSGTLHPDLQFEHEGRVWIVDDQYCMKPSCRCKDVYLTFINIDPNGKTAEPAFRIRFSQDGSTTNIEYLENQFERAKAQEIVEVFSRKIAGNRDFLKDRAIEMKRKGREILENRDQQGPRSGLGAARPGRNDPCPCGSGKKYKKCCGR